MEKLFYGYEIRRMVNKAMMEVLHDGLSEMPDPEKLSAYLVGAEKLGQEIGGLVTKLEAAEDDDEEKKLL